MPNSSRKSATPDRPPTNNNSSRSSSSASSTPTSNSIRRQPRKKRRIEKEKDNNEQQQQQRTKSLDSNQLGECNIEDAKEIDRRLRQVARANAISSEDMHKVVRRVVRNEHVLALVTLKAEDEMAREKREAEAKEEQQHQQQRGAIIITETPSVAKLTRAKARELNCTPGISLPSLNETPVNEIEALIREELHSDEEDEEYTFTKEDFHSDDDPNTTASDLDSNPCTPQTPLTANEESPVKFTSDGCFKLPPDKNSEDPRIATRTRSKLCLQQTTIEDLQSEFVPPDLEQSDIPEYDMTANDAEWMQFLTDFAKPLNNSFLGDDDDPINDPEYVAAEMVPVDAEELRDVNISKKELTDLVSELFAGLLQEGVSLDSIELETPQKFLTEQEQQEHLLAVPIEQVTRQIDFDTQPAMNMESFQPQLMSTPSVVSVPLADNLLNGSHFDSSCTTVNISAEAIGAHPPELIAVPLPGQPNCFQLAKVMTNMPAESSYVPAVPAPAALPVETDLVQSKPSEPYDINFSWKYLSVRKHIYAEYEEHFESLRHIKPATPAPAASNVKGFTQEQHDLLQQQLRVHTQMLTQTFLQTYSHPTLYAMAEKPKQMLQELHQRASKDASFNCWNLNDAMELVNKWEHDLNSDEHEEQNKKMMQFINKETQLTEGHTRQVPRLPPRIMDLMLDSKVFMYPQYLPRMAFQPKKVQFTAYAPSEYQLMAMGLEKHLNAIKSSKCELRKGADPIRTACKRMTKDLVHGKQARRLSDKVKELRDMEQYNPVKYYFEHERAPPVNQILLGFEGGTVRTPREQHQFLPSAWKYYIEKNWYNDKRIRRTKKELQSHQASNSACASYLEFVREAVGEDLVLPDSEGVPAVPHGSATGSTWNCETGSRRRRTPPFQVETKSKRRAKLKDQNQQSLTINVNYVFGGEIGANLIAGVSVPFQPSQGYAQNVANINRTLLDSSSECTSSLLAPPPPLPALAEDAPPAINFRFDPVTATLENNCAAVQTQAKLKTRPIHAKRARCPIYKRSYFNKRRCRLTATPSRSLLRQELQLRCLKLITSYANYLEKQRDKYSHAKSVQYYYRRFLALELYTQLLVELRMFCESPSSSPTESTTTTTPTNCTGSPQQQKRQRCEDEARNRKANRQEEMQRHMLQPDSPDEKNRKDATFAYNFYERVEEALLMANRLEDCHRFNQLLQSFDPSHDKVSDLYLKVEKLLLPEYPELAEVFLNFLLPAEAAELGKFFEYFMITNASNFINKLNLYFCKQPAQIRKIYACLSELAEMPNVSMKKVEARILPLLKGNQFLCDWFVQQFPQAKPPQLILPPAEKTNLHDVMANTTGVFAETVHDVPDELTVLSPQQQQQQQTKSPGCQLRYLNGRIFYGSKIMLPAKLSFRAASIYNEQCHDPLSGEHLNCAHGEVRVQGEKLISAAAAVDSDDAADRSEEDEASRTLIIDTTPTGDDDNSGSPSSVDLCDDVALRAHAMRLNGNYYNSSFNNAATSTPNISQHSAQHHPNAKKTAINFGELSPRRHTSCNLSPLSGLSPLPATGGLSPQLDKRKSPSKKVRSPLGQSSRPKYNMPPMVMIHEPAARLLPAASSSAIEFAKRLRTLINEESDEVDSKEDIGIKDEIADVAKLEEEEAGDQDEPLSPLPAMKMDLESSPIDNDNDEAEAEVELLEASNRASATPPHLITTQFDSDEDCKLDVVASLANSSLQQDEADSPLSEAMPTEPSATSAATSSAPLTAWTRDEDKVILIEMKRGARDREHLIKRMGEILKNRNEMELRMRHQFLMEFLSKLQGK